jgi:uncharacterized Zn-binding protein involved in type VI secretion
MWSPIWDIIMGYVIRKGDSATCGHTASGSTDVFVNGRGASRVGKDKAGGVILGPGCQTVFVNGYPISLRGDSVAGHGKDAHANPTMTGGSENVFAC